MGIAGLLSALHRFFQSSGEQSSIPADGDLAWRFDRALGVDTTGSDSAESRGPSIAKFLGVLSASVIAVNLVLEMVNGSVSPDIIPNLVMIVFLTFVIVLIAFAMYGFAYALRASNTKSHGFLEGAASEESKHSEEIQDIRASHRSDMRIMGAKMDAVLQIVIEIVPFIPVDRQSEVMSMILRLQAVHDIGDIVSDIRASESRTSKEKEDRP